MRAETWKMSTQDIVFGAILGALNAAWIILGGLGFVGIALAPVLGGVGVVAFAVPYGLTLALPVVAGYLRRNGGVVVLAALLTGALRWLTGDPDGLNQLLLQGIPGVIIALVADRFGWPDRIGPWVLAGALAALGSWTEWFIVNGTAFITQQPVWLWVVGMFVTAMISGALLGGGLGVYLGRLLTRVGITPATASRPVPAQ